MKPTLLLLFAVVCFATSSKAQIPNNDFENWTNMGSYNSPDNWDNPDAMTSGMGVYCCMKGTPGAVGSAYLKLVSKNVSGIGVVPGIVVSGKMNVATKTVTSGFAYSMRPKSLTGKWQYMAYGGDQGFVEVTLTKWNSATKQRDIVATNHYALPGMAMAWASFSINLNYVSNATPDSAYIILSSSGTTPVANSYLYADNLMFSASTTGINETAFDVNNLNIYPNPASGGSLFIDYPSDIKISTVQIIDMQGRTMNQIESVLNNKKLINIQNLAIGQYILVLISNEGIIRKSFIRE